MSNGRVDAGMRNANHVRQTRRLLLSTAQHVLRLVPMRAFEALVPREMVAFCYHVVSDRPVAHIESLYRSKTIPQFQRDLTFLHQHFNLIGYADIATGHARAAGKRRDALLTFDDGFVECYDVIRPLLLQSGTPATFFLTTDFLDNRRLFYRHKIALCLDTYSRLSSAAATAVRQYAAQFFAEPSGRATDLSAYLQSARWQDEAAIDAVCDRLGVDVAEYLRHARPYLSRAQVRTLAADGFTIGAHGTSHQQLGTMQEAAAEQDILAACAEIATLVPDSIVPFAFPFNGHGVNRELLRSLRQANPRIGLFFDTKSVARDLDFVKNRLVVDDPRITMMRGTNLPTYLRRAYAGELMRMITHRNA